ncbi:zinc finger CCCH domain-containing protein 44-like isoform X3 [Sesamum indicum]|uniref:Zinc finger CCCH domain-containing protein 44-like isoform X3 n=1 Tax=Sesamum indicum TaxID=4182 RepID=A0A8M8V7T0_SESIN|nr:zinc finger CCCH domain-containing protein 44-like isoform X3 [Sesamum indicum]
MENIETLLAAVAQTQGFDDDEPVASTAAEVGLEGSESSPVVRGEISGLQLTGEVSGDARPSAVVDTPPPAQNPAFLAVGHVIGAGERRKRGRPPKGQIAAKPPPPKRKKQEDEEEDVCFICFDGGSLVLCDRKGCPKAYHPACIKRDEAFFKSKAKWTCGWHICSVCRKASHYMCYTCTYSLCKGCTKDADYLCVRGNKGFCSTCMKTIMLIENKDKANNESVQVDFDDKSSWEYLFKVYWVYLKEKLSLTLTELTQAKKPWKEVAAVACKPQLSDVLHTAVDGKVSISYKSTEHLELNKPHIEINLPQSDGLATAVSSIDNHGAKLNRDKVENGPSHSLDTVKQNMDEVTDESSINKATDEQGIKEATYKPSTEKKQDYSNIVKDSEKPCICKTTNSEESDKPSVDCITEWASKDLLEFVAHMKHGDTSAISQFDVQTLLLEYIKRNNLRDPRRKSQIICDPRLKNLFGKPRVGHIEMLKLLEYHFLIKEDSQNNSFIPAGFVGSVASDMDVDGNIYDSPMPSNSRKRKARKKSEEKAAPQNDLNEYAAIDVHNINLIYLRRNLMEHLVEDKNFNDKVIGSIVRIRISNIDQKPDVYRLVQVVGISKVAEPYKIGDRTADVMLEVLNLDKTEVVSIDAISNQEFTEDECRRLRQSIRCGLVKQFTVGEVQKKAMALQPVRINDWLEAEILRLNHLRDRASEKGRKKELREYVDKLQLLKSPEERQRRLSEVPEVHADPKMSPDYESEEDARSCENSTKDYVRPSYSGFPRKGRKPLSPNKKGKEEKYIQMHSRLIEKSDASGSNSSDKHMNQANSTKLAIGGRNDQVMQRSGLETATATATATACVGNSLLSNNIETEKLWHYRDPNGKIQGPFSMMQLRKWSTTGLFPPDMRIWTNHEQYDSLLLIDALNGLFHRTSDLSYKPSSGSQEHGSSASTSRTERDSKQTEAAWSDNNTGLVRADESGSSRPRCWDLLKDNNSSADNVQARNLLPSSSSDTHLPQPDRGQESEEVNHASQDGEKSSSGLTTSRMTSEPELPNQPNNEDPVCLSSEDKLRLLNVNLSSNDMESGSVPAPVSKSFDSSNLAVKVDVLDLPSPTPGTAENQQSVSLDVQNSVGFLELLSPTPRSNNEDQGGQATETKQSGVTNFPMQNSGPSWSTASSLVVGGVQIPEVADEWCGYSPTPVRPSVQEWDSGLVSASSSKPTEVSTGNAATSISDSHNLTHASPSHPASNIPNWLAILNEPIEFDALGEESVSDLLAEVDAMESRGALPSPTSAMKFARELMEDCKDDCFSTIEDFSATHDIRKSDALSSTGEMRLTSQSSVPCKPVEPLPIDAFDSFRRSSVHSSASSEGETNAPVYSGDAGSEIHPAAPNTSQEMVGTTMAPTIGSDIMDPGWGNVHGNINLVTVQGNVNLVLGGPTQGMANLSWGSNPGTAWVNPNINCSSINGSLPWDGQRKYGGERFTSPRERGYQGSDSGFGRGRPPWGRQPYGGGYSRPLLKGQRVCKFFESGHCKKGAYCDYLHP